MNMARKMTTLIAAMSVLSTCFAAKVTLEYGDGETLEPEDSLYFSTEDIPEEIQGYPVLEEYLPDGVEVTWTGKKFKTPKKGKVKYSKNEEDFITTNDDNPCGLTVKYSKKKKTVKGSFKVYVAKSEKKVKSYKASFSGRLGEEFTITIKKGGTATGSMD